MPDSLKPELFPEPWATAYGQDRYGLWQSLDIDDVELRMRWIPPGAFLMGDDTDFSNKDEQPVTQIRIEYGFWMAETVTTQALWQAIMNNNPSDFKKSEVHRQLPVESISYVDIQEFLLRLHSISGVNFILPSEAQWEYACRAGTIYQYWWGNGINSKQANYGRDLDEKGTVNVLEYKANPWGLFQMHGNVWEFCADVWNSNHKGADRKGLPRYGPIDAPRVCRGGSWINRGSALRSASRNSYRDGNRRLGFRLARGPVSSSQVRSGPG